MLIAVLLLSGCGLTKQVNVVGHKTLIPGESAEQPSPIPEPEKEEVVLPQEPEQEIAVLPEPVVIELEAPPPAKAFEAPEVISEPKLPPWTIQPVQPPAMQIEEQVLASSEVSPPQVEFPPPTLADVFFDFDETRIRKDEIVNIEGNAKLLNGHYQDSSLLIEGHCDERGTIEYNLVLGERRAQAVKSYLVDLGIAPSKIQTISYGKEKPFCTQHSVQCWQQNRRAHFVVR